jgi:hypothetical protein
VAHERLDEAIRLRLDTELAAFPEVDQLHFSRMRNTIAEER